MFRFAQGNDASYFLCTNGRICTLPLRPYLTMHRSSRLGSTSRRIAQPSPNGSVMRIVQRQHLRAAEHPGAKASGPVTANARFCIYDFAWNVRMAFRYGLIPNIGCTELWLADAALGTICDLPLELQRKILPPILHRHGASFVSISC